MVVQKQPAIRGECTNNRWRAIKSREFPQSEQPTNTISWVSTICKNQQHVQPVLNGASNQQLTGMMNKVLNLTELGSDLSQLVTSSQLVSKLSTCSYGKSWHATLDLNQDCQATLTRVNHQCLTNVTWKPKRTSFSPWNYDTWVAWSKLCKTFIYTKNAARNR